MAPPSVPTGFPARLIAGDTVVFDLGALSSAQGSFTSTDYTLTLVATSPAGMVEATGVAQGTGWRLTLSTTDTKTLKRATELEVETVRWFAHCTSGSERYTPASGQALIWPDPASLDGYLSADERILALIVAKLEGRIEGDVERYTIAGRAFDLLPVAELLKLKAHYSAKVAQARNGGAFQTLAERFR